MNFSWTIRLLFLLALTCLLLGAGTLEARAYMVPSTAAGDEGHPEAEVIDHQDLRLSDYTYEDMLLPDLRTLPPTDLRLEIDRRNDTRLLRFANTIWNSGLGPLEMHGDRPSGTDTVDVRQLIRFEDGLEIYYDAGQFHYHIEHGHWHWENFSLYQVWTVAPNGRLVDLAVYSDKVGYCLFDVSRYRGSYNTTIEGPHYRQYLECNPLRQGLSVGWTDTYRAHLPGQYVDVSQLADGLYALRSIVDPGGLILESNYANNAAVVYFILQGEQVMVVENPEEILEPAGDPF